MLGNVPRFGVAVRHTHVGVALAAVTLGNLSVSRRRLAVVVARIHCRIGADRTGLACALFELVVRRRPADLARRQLSWRYGHVPWLDGRSHAMDQAFAEVALAMDELKTIRAS